MTICYFTATGNCLYVAKRIGGTLLSIPKLMRQEKIEIIDEIVGIISPCYACEMPMMVSDFIAKAKINTKYFFFIYTYGMGYAEAFAHVELATQKAGLKLNYINAIKMVDNYLPIFEMEDQLRQLPNKNVEGQIENVCKDIAERKNTTISITPVTMSEISKYSKLLAEPILRKDTAKEYIVNDSCIACGICSKVCPANNITVTDKPHFHDRCEVCYSCLHNCPKNAIHLKKETSNARFRNKNVTLKEIIDSNE